MNTISEEIYEFGKSLPKSNDAKFEFNKILNRYLSWPLQVNAGLAHDNNGVTTEQFDTIIYTSI